MIYLIILLFILLPVLLYDFGGAKRGWQFWYFTELIMLILLAGLRYRTGGDTLIYMEYFEDYPNIDELFEFDFVNADFNPLWYIYNAIIKSIWDDFIFFQIVQAIIVNTIFFVFFKKHTKYFFTAIFIYSLAYYLYFNMEILREALAVCIFMLSFKYLQNKKLLKYFICVIFAYLFHYSAMIMFIIPFFIFLPKLEWKFTFIIFLIIIMILSVFNITPILTNIFVNNVVLSEKVEAYTTLEGNVLNIKGVIGYLTPIILLMFTSRDLELSDFENKTQNLLFLYAILIGFSIFYPAMFSRMQNYIIPFYIIFIVNTTIPFIKKNFNISYNRQLIIKFTILWFLVISMRTYFVDCSEYMLGAKSYNIYYPYHSIFDPVIEVERENFVEMYKKGNNLNN